MRESNAKAINTKSDLTWDRRYVIRVVIITRPIPVVPSPVFTFRSVDLKTK